jgi:Glycosyltransferase family 87
LISSRLQSFIDRRLQREKVRFVCLAYLGTNLVLAVVAFVTFDGTNSMIGPAPCVDFTGFYTAGKILNEQPPHRVYDLDLQDQILHEVFPGLRPETKLPYVYPPFFTLVFRPLALLPYAWACLVWMLALACLYLVGFALIWRSLSAIPSGEWSMVLLLTLSFQPCVDCWLSGQTSAFGFVALALALYCERSGRPFAVGLCLALCLYKPTLVWLPILMMAVARRGWVLGGAAVGGLILAGISLLVVGWRGCLAYAHLAHAFTRLINAESIGFPVWKYIDLHNFLGSLLGRQSPYRTALWIACAVLVLPRLARSWWSFTRSEPDRRVLLWSSSLTWTLVLNYYVGIYDGVLAAPGAMMTTDVLCRRRGGIERALSPGLRSLLALLYLVPWISQLMARSLGLQPFTVVLAVMAAYQLVLAGPSDGACVMEETSRFPGSAVDEFRPDGNVTALSARERS